MEEQENHTPLQMLTMVQQALVTNAKTIENLESSAKDMDLKREKCRDDLTNHYQSVIAVLQEVYQFALVEVDTECEKKKEDLQRKEKYLTRCSLSLMSELENLKSGSSDAESAVRRSKLTLEKLGKDLQKKVANVTFNFIPKKGKVRLGFLQHCDDLPQDFALRLFTPILDIKIGHQIRCGIEGNFTVENLRHLEFGIRRNNDVVPFVNLGTQGDVFSFSFAASSGGVYVILACLFGSPIANSPLTLTIHHPGSNSINQDAMVNPLDVISDTCVKTSETVTECNEKIPILAEEDFSERTDTELKNDKNVSESQQQMKRHNNENDENQNEIDAELNLKSGLYDTKESEEVSDEKCNDLKQNEITAEAKLVISSQDRIVRDVNKQKAVAGAGAGEKGIGRTFREGDNCVALWQEDGIWYNGQIEAINEAGSFLVKFVDYGNSDNVAASNIVKSAPDIPKDVPEENVDECVSSRSIDKELEHLTSNNNTENSKENVLDETDVKHLEASRKDSDYNRNIEISINQKVDKNVHLSEAKKTTFDIGEACVAQWSEDLVWYNGIVQAVEKDETYIVTFTDYGNSDAVRKPFILKDAFAIPSEDHVDENVRNAISVPSGGNCGIACTSDRNKSLESNNRSSKPAKGESSQRKISDCGVRMITSALKQVNLFNSKQEVSLSRRQGPSLASDEEIMKADKPIKTTVKDASATSMETSNAVISSVKKTPVAQCNSSEDFEIDNKAAARTHKDDFAVTKECLTETLIKKKRSKSKPSMPRPLMESKVEPETAKSKATVWKAGDVCLAQWNDGVWYNSVIDNKKMKFGHDTSCEVSYNITFTDYGNQDQVPVSRIVKSHNDLLHRKDHVVLDENVKVNLATIAQANNLWKTGERCLAKDRDGIWYNAKIEDINSNGLLTVQLIDYDRKAEVDLKFLVRSSQDIPQGHQQMVDQNVEIEKKGSEEKDDVDDKIKMKRHVIGESGIARWSEDHIWYNAEIINVNEDGSLDVIFVDYGNRDTVKPPFFVKNTSLIEETGEAILFNEHVEEYVDETILNQQLDRNSVSPSHCPLPISPDKVAEEFTYSQVKTEMKIDSSFSGSTFSNRSQPEAVKQDESFNILEHVTRTADGRQELVVKCSLNLSDNITSPLGIAILRNKNIVISCSKDDSVKIFRRDGTLSTTIESVRPFQTPTSVTVLSTGDFVVRDDIGLQMFTQEGVFVRTLGGDKIDKCYGLAEDESGNIITVNSAKPITIDTIDSEVALSNYVDLVFKKAIGDPVSTLPCAQMCKVMQMPIEGQEEKIVNFRKLLISRCQREFEKDYMGDLDRDQYIKDMNDAKTEEDKKRVKAEFEFNERRLRQKSLGIMRFIVELYKLQMLTARIMHECVKSLLTRADDQSLECLCCLFNTVGKILDQETRSRLQKGSAQQNAGINDLDKYFKEMEVIMKDKKTSARVRFLMQDVVELRLNNWKNRREDAGTKTIERIHKSVDLTESRERGGLTDVGETDIFFISRDSGEVVQRIELSDVISDKNESKCRFLNYHDKTIYIADLGLDCFYKVKIDGVQVFTVGETGTGVQQFRDPAGIAVDDFGNLIVADSRNHRLQIYDREDNFVGFVAVDVPVHRPSGIFLDKQLGELYVLNYGSNSMAKYRIGY